MILEYCFRCFASDGGCDHRFQISCDRNEISGKKPTCPVCRKRKTVHRDYGSESIMAKEHAPRTIGALADKNSEKLSDEQKSILTKKHKAYLENRPGRPLRDGMEYGLKLDNAQLKKDPYKNDRKNS